LQQKSIIKTAEQAKQQETTAKQWNGTGRATVWTFTGTAANGRQRGYFEK